MRSERGYAMAALLVGMAVMAIMLGVALPVWRTAVQREREAELVFRGEQYANAIEIFQRRTGGYPQTLDLLEKTRAIRRLYKDPITGGDFQPVFVGQMIGGAPVVPGQAGRGGAGQPGRAAARTSRRARRRRDRAVPAAARAQPAARGPAAKPVYGRGSGPAGVWALDRQARRRPARSSASSAAAPAIRCGSTTAAASTTSGRSSRPPRRSRRARPTGEHRLPGCRPGRPAARSSTRRGPRADSGIPLGQPARPGTAGSARTAGGRGGQQRPCGYGRGLQFPGSAGIQPTPARGVWVRGAQPGDRLQPDLPGRLSELPSLDSQRPSSRITASCTAGRTCLIASFARDGCTRFVSSTM